MNSLERVLTTISHKEPDRVPIGEWGIDHDHVSKILGHHTYWRNRKDSTIALWEGRRDEVVESMKEDYTELIEKLGYDIIPVELVPPKGFVCSDPPKKVGEGLWEDSAGNIFKYAASNDSIVCVSHPPAKFDLKEFEVEEAINGISDIENSQFELVDYICQKFGKTKAVVFRGISIDRLMLEFFGGDESHKLMIPSLVPEAVVKTSEYALAYNDMLIKQCAKRDISVMMCGRDYGNTRGCMESPKTIREIYMPVHKKFIDSVVDSGRIPFLHCCGCVWEIMDDFINAGYKGYQSIQGSAGMDLAKVKNLYGDKLTLWAGVQCENLIEGTKETVENEVKRALEVAMPNGGFIFGSTNSVQFGANTDNYLYALDIVRKHGKYV